jgi:antitoxin component of MazEF toxin-antitoxin module
MQKTLTKHGNSYALVIDKPIMDLLRITPETPFEIMSDGQCLVLTPVRDPKEIWACDEETRRVRDSCYNHGS